MKPVGGKYSLFRDLSFLVNREAPSISDEVLIGESIALEGPSRGFTSLRGERNKFFYHKDLVAASQICTSERHFYSVSTSNKNKEKPFAFHFYLRFVSSSL